MSNILYIHIKSWNSYFAEPCTCGFPPEGKLSGCFSAKVFVYRGWPNLSSPYCLSLLALLKLGKETFPGSPKKTVARWEL